MRQRSIFLACLAMVTAGCSGGGGGGGVPAPGSTMTFQNVQANVFTPSCAIGGCHVGAGAPFGLDLSQGQALGNIRGIASAEAPAFMRVDPFDAANSYLVMKVTGDARITGDPMPATGSLSQGQIDLLIGWIAQGADP